MKYFRYDKLQAATIYSPTDATGRAVDVLYGDRSEEFGYRSASTLAEAFLAVQAADELRDCMYCPSSYLLISERLSAALMDFRVDDAIVLLPVSITGIEWPKKYYLLYSKEARDPFDYEASQFDYFPRRPDTIRSVKEYVFDINRLPPFAMFRTPQFDWIMDESLVECLTKLDFSGHCFSEIWNSAARHG